MQNFSIQEIKLLSSLELHETKRAICKMILASFESYKRENPSCPVLISFSLASEAQNNSLSENGCKGQNWLLSGQWLQTKFKQLTAIRAALRIGETRGASFIPLNILEVSLSTDINNIIWETDTTQMILIEALAALVLEKTMHLC